MSKSTAIAPDNHDIESLSGRLLSIADELSRQAPELAKARTVREYSSERNKRALALATSPFLADNSASAADTFGRASKEYGDAMAELRKQTGAAEYVIAQHDATRAQFEAVRSVLSSLKMIAGNL